MPTVLSLFFGTKDWDWFQSSDEVGGHANILFGGLPDESRDCFNPLTR